jgi:hypothetical protein
MGTGSVAAFGGCSLSTACTAKLNLPLVVGVPLMAPLVLLSVRPGGALPELIFQ